MAKFEHDLISREAAALQGRKTFYLATPCKNGHVSPRYVTNGGCLECARRWKRAGAINPRSHDLVPWSGVVLWRSRRLTPEQLAGLDQFVQRAIDSYCAHYLPPVCATCDGTGSVIKPSTAGVQWIDCPVCKVNATAAPAPKATADSPSPSPSPTDSSVPASAWYPHAGTDSDS